MMGVRSRAENERERVSSKVEETTTTDTTDDKKRKTTLCLLLLLPVIHVWSFESSVMSYAMKSL